MYREEREKLPSILKIEGARCQVGLKKAIAAPFSRPVELMTKLS